MGTHKAPLEASAHFQSCGLRTLHPMVCQKALGVCLIVASELVLGLNFHTLGFVELTTLRDTHFRHEGYLVASLLLVNYLASDPNFAVSIAALLRCAVFICAMSTILVALVFSV